MTATKTPTTYTVVNGIALKCGADFKCHRAATYILARVVRSVDWQGRPRKYEANDIKNALYCNVHRGAQMRVAARPGGAFAETSYYPIDAPEAQAALDKYTKVERKYRDEAEVERLKKVEESTRKNRRLNEDAWAQYGDRVTVTESVEEEDRWTDLHITTYRWTLQSASVPHWRQPGVEVEVREPRAADNWWDVDPVEVRVRSTWNEGSATARAMAEALTLAARVAERENERLATIRSQKMAALECDDCGRTDGTHNDSVEH